MEIGIDVIGDLFLSPNDEFDWSGKSTSLYCIVTGNVGNDMGTLHKTLDNIAENYKGVFYISGHYEFEDCDDIRKRTDEINYVCQQIPNVASLWHHVVILESIAILGCNGFGQEEKYNNHLDQITATELRYEDLVYLKNSVSKLQKHGDVKSIISVTNSVPSPELYFGEVPEYAKSNAMLDLCIGADTENKITHWAFGSYGKAVDISINGITYISNPYNDIRTYWPKRIVATI